MVIEVGGKRPALGGHPFDAAAQLNLLCQQRVACGAVLRTFAGQAARRLSQRHGRLQRLCGSIYGSHEGSPRG
ncbi:hypothetical protein BSU04_11175 [Caballeronia sordidicola]|uniref:Uncharacterized protein n=1 Tax=Caballeronia sordidicola TaxID=196367 RepID=A0A226X6W7_CABSO|nr:hypothetical protein BSU04_11175 [Caballeronia sordidicola]